jgi:hypothetical protein
MHTALKYVIAVSSCIALAATLAVAADSPATAKQDKYTVKVPGGLGFAEFKGYESWQVISVSHNPKAMAVIVGNPTMIKAFAAGIPANGKPVPDGARMAKMHYLPKQNQFFRRQRAGAEGRRLHGEGQQALRRQRRLKLCSLQVRSGVRRLRRSG